MSSCGRASLGNTCRSATPWTRRRYLRQPRRFSDEIDVAIYDRQYTPLIFEHQGELVIPIESVYDVFESKQEITGEFITYAQNKSAQSASSIERARQLGRLTDCEPPSRSLSSAVSLPLKMAGRQARPIHFLHLSFRKIRSLAAWISAA